MSQNLWEKEMAFLFYKFDIKVGGAHKNVSVHIYIGGGRIKLVNFPCLKLFPMLTMTTNLRRWCIMLFLYLSKGWEWWEAENLGSSFAMYIYGFNSFWKIMNGKRPKRRMNFNENHRKEVWTLTSFPILGLISDKLNLLQDMVVVFSVISIVVWVRHSLKPSIKT